MIDKKVEKMKMEASERVSKDVWTKMDEKQSRMICEMRTIMFDEIDKIYKDIVLLAPDVSPKDRLKMVVESIISEISKQMHMSQGEVLSFLLFDKVLYEIALEKSIRYNLANSPEYQELTRRMTDEEVALEKEKKKVEHAKKELAKVKKEKERRKKLES